MRLQTIIRLLSIILLTLACKPEPPTEPIGTDPNPDNPPSQTMQSYLPLGVGGGGAMSGISISPYTNTRFVGTDMGTLFRSVDSGLTWLPINHYEADFDSRLPLAVSPGFLADGATVFHASAGELPIRSTDEGITFLSMEMGLRNSERIVFWHEDTQDENNVFAGTTEGLLLSKNKGLTWKRTAAPSSEITGSYIDHYQGTTTLYISTGKKIFKSNNDGDTFSVYHTASPDIRMFTGGRDSQGISLVYGDSDGSNACAWAFAYVAEWGQTAINDTVDTCGYVWVKKNNASFFKTNQIVGDHLKMAENDSLTIYTTGGKYWIRQYGTKVHISKNAGSSWNLILHQLNWDLTPFEAWPDNKIELSAVALDVGWWDDGYESFAINRLNSSQIAGSGYFFLHSSENKGNYWDAPFTSFEDSGLPTAGKKWKTQGIEVISVYNLKYHPINKNLIYVASADIGGMISDDAGDTFRVSKAGYNSNYDYAFDTTNDQIAYAASGNEHDYPEGWHANATVSNGGIYKSSNQGHDWIRLTPNNNSWNRQFLSVAYDTSRNVLYAGSQGVGVARSTNGGQSWHWLNSGFPSGNKIIPQLEIDPVNGNIYALLTGNAPNFTNRTKTGIYFLDVINGATSWVRLRGVVNYPPEADSGYKTWWYPTGFAIDFSDVQRNTFWLVDYENNGNWLMTGAWKSTDRGQTWDRKIQFTHPTSVTIDPINPNLVFVSGSHYLDGTWGNGGQIFSTDAGETWKRNLSPTLQHNGRNVIIDPNNNDNVFYTFFGGGILKGPNPTRNPAAVETEVVTSE